MQVLFVEGPTDGEVVAIRTDCIHGMRTDWTNRNYTLIYSVSWPEGIQVKGNTQELAAYWMLALQEEIEFELDDEDDDDGHEDGPHDSE